MIRIQEKLDLKNEVKDLVIVANDNEQTDFFYDVFNQKLEQFNDELFTTIHTLGKLKAKRLHIIGKNKLANDENLKKVIANIIHLKDECIVLTDSFTQDELGFLPLLVEKMVVQSYKMDTFKSKKADKKSDVSFYGQSDINSKIEEGMILGESINKAKDLVNTPYNYMNAKDLADYAKTLEKYDGISVKIYEKTEIEEMNMGSFLGVNKGSSDEPYLIFIEYKSEGNSDEPLALVGKGVMYDTGGYSLKTPQSMPGMKVDMAGAAAVVSAIEGIARLKLDCHVYSIVAATDNRIGDGAIVPDDILTAANGKTIEIVSTDAEGRLTLADAVWFAQEKGAKKVIDVATLTGAILVSLAQYYTGAFTNDQKFYDEFKKVTEESKEDIWLMPVSKAFHDELKSNVADISNKGGRFGGSSIAAAFIEEFINEDTSWIHLDVAGTASNKKDGATGVMVKSFIKLFQK
ncbi:leucyl aminopeptidase family protein [Mycoplasmatota bacterium]|nr:leucyl aminopeptidase family protein [Mycoplasmatota bacterium]